jgi:hypothetical protein
MTKSADDKLGHAKREIKALTGQLAEAKEHVERLEFCLAGQESISELLESLTESDGKLISKLHEQVAELEANAVVPEGLTLVPATATREIENAIGRNRNMKASEIWEVAVSVASKNVQQHCAQDGGEQVKFTCHGNSAPAYSCDKPGDMSGTYYTRPLVAVPDDSKHHAVMQAQMWAQEARTQKAIVKQIGEIVGCASSNDWEMVEAVRNALSNASGGSLHDCCCGETEQAWRLCPLHPKATKDGIAAHILMLAKQDSAE